MKKITALIILSIMGILQTGGTTIASNEQTPNKEHSTQLTEGELGFLSMIFSQDNNPKNLIKSIIQTQDPEEKRFSLFGLLSEAKLSDFSLKELTQIIMTIKTLPTTQIRKLFYKIEKTYGERFLYDFVVQYILTSEYYFFASEDYPESSIDLMLIEEDEDAEQTTPPLMFSSQAKEIKSINDALLTIVIKACCPEQNETAEMKRQRQELFESFLKGFSTAPKFAMKEKEHKRYFKLISRIEPQEQGELLRKLMEHIGSFIKFISSLNTQAESQHFSLDVLFHMLKKLYRTNPESIENWIKNKQHYTFLKQIKSFYSNDLITHLADTFGPRLPETYTLEKFKRYLRETAATKNKVTLQAEQIPVLFFNIEEEYKKKQKEQQKLFTIYKKSFSDIDIYLQ